MRLLLLLLLPLLTTEGTAATVDLSAIRETLKEGELLAAYVETPSGAEIVIADAEGTIGLPAATRVVPLVMRRSAEEPAAASPARPGADGIVRFGEELVLKEGETLRLAQIRTPDAGKADVVVKVAIASPKNARGAGPAVQLVAPNGDVVATERLRAAPAFHESLVFFRNVPAQRYRVALAGDGWVRSEQAANVAANEVHSTALTASVPAVLAVRWTLDPAFLDEVPPACGAEAADTNAPAVEEEEAVRPQVTIRRCTPEVMQRLARHGASRCEAVVSRKIESGAASGEERFEALRGGEYVAELKFGDHAAYEVVQWSGTEDARSSVTLGASYVMGRVSKDGEPVRARLEFPNGITTTDEATGTYRLLISRPVDRVTLVEVTPCGSERGYVHRTSGPVIGGSVHDIDIPSGGIAVTATSRADGKPIAGATVSIVEDEVEFPLYELETPPTDAEGQTSLEPVLRDVPLLVCAYAKGFIRECRGAITVEDETVKVALRLQPRPAGVAGRVVSSKPVQPGARMWLVQNGVQLAIAPVDQEKRFHFDALPPGATLVLTDSAHGLVVIGRPALDGEGTVLATVPETAPVSFQVVISDRSRRGGSPLTVQVGDVLVPLTVFWHHQALTGGKPAAVPGVPFAVNTIVPTAPISVILGFEYGKEPPDLQGDMFARPDLIATMPRKQVQSPLVTFD
ncbi:MAG TPA: hypothetical protein VE974_24500 [Thermoanaerobaculia bacterium]|nr:hypothetical protein [Thermoanaerobaculia bacterium]